MVGILYFLYFEITFPGSFSENMLCKICIISQWIYEANKLIVKYGIAKNSEFE